jgi:regulator of replication initiation timing
MDELEKLHQENQALQVEMLNMNTELGSSLSQTEKSLNETATKAERIRVSHSIHQLVNVQAKSISIKSYCRSHQAN